MRTCLPTTPHWHGRCSTAFRTLEPLNHLQVELLRRYRSGDQAELVQRGILLTMRGLAAALRNSG